MNKRSLVNWGVRLGSIALVTSVAGTLASNPSNSKNTSPISDSNTGSATQSGQTGTNTQGNSQSTKDQNTGSFDDKSEQLDQKGEYEGSEPYNEHDYGKEEDHNGFFSNPTDQQQLQPSSPQTRDALRPHTRTRAS